MPVSYPAQVDNWSVDTQADQSVLPTERTITPNPTQSIMRVAAALYHVQRDAYIELHGIPAMWHKVETHERRDFYGDIKKTLVRTDLPLTIVLELGSNALEILDTYPDPTTNDYAEAITGHIKFNTDIKAGDRISFNLGLLQPQFNDTKFLQVTQVTMTGNPVLTSKIVKLVPVRDANQT